jgi:hypothetical protein
MVIRTRTDLAFTTGKPEYEKIKESLEIDPTLLITSNGEPHGSPYAIEDIFFITSSDSMNVFSNAVKNVETYNKNGVQAESMYAYHAVTSGLKITPSNFKADTRVGTSLIDGVEVSNFGRWA